MHDLDVFVRARAAFRRARRRAFFRSALMSLRGRSNQLLAYDEVRERLHVGGPVYRGLQSVPLDRIVGSVGRYRDFDRAFLPSQDFTEDRWQSIGRAFFQDISLPPVKLYQVGDVYFVVDGNHRVSVARQMGQEFIDAEVQESQVRVPVTADLDPEALEILGEKVDFLSRTRLDKTRPGIRFEMTIAGGYRILLEHIAVHRYLQSQEWRRAFGDEEAAAQWCDQVYMPVVNEIRWTGILGDFPGRTETDLYVWVVEHLGYLRQQYGERVSRGDAARSFARRFTGGLVRRVWHFITRPFHRDLPPSDANVE